MAPQQTVSLVASIRHARVIGISDHLEYVIDSFDAYADAVRGLCLRLGAEVNGAEWVPIAARLPLDYFVYHCRDRKDDYEGVAVLLAAGNPVIIAHPRMLDTNPDRLPAGCLIEIDNRYVWQQDGEALDASCLGREPEDCTKHLREKLLPCRPHEAHQTWESHPLCTISGLM